MIWESFLGDGIINKRLRFNSMGVDAIKRLLSLLTVVVFAIGLSGCFQPLDKDGMVFGGKKVESEH